MPDKKSDSVTYDGTNTTVPMIDTDSSDDGPQQPPMSRTTAFGIMAAISGMTEREYYHAQRRDKRREKRKHTHGAFGKQD